MICIERYCEVFYVLDCVVVLLGCVFCDWSVIPRPWNLYSWALLIEVTPWIKKAWWNVVNELKVVIINDKLMVLLDRSVTFQHGILGSVTFPHGIIRSKCHIPTRYNWIGVSRSEMIVLKEKYIELTECTQSQRTQFPKWFSWDMSPHGWCWHCWLLLHTYFNVVDTRSCCLLLFTY